MRSFLSPIVAFCMTTSVVSAEPAGYTPFGIDAPHHGRGMIGAIWYPSQGDGRAFRLAENAVFHGVTVVEEATIRDGEYPVVVLSHGMGGNIRSLTWLASSLAEKGAIVVAVNHPNSTWGDFDLALGLQHWTRVQDLSLALDTLMEMAQFDGHIDETRIMAAGFSYGGWTALSMGGLRGNHAGYVAHCTEYGAASSHCGDLMSAEIQVANVDENIWNASYADPRINHIVAIDPGLIWGLDSNDTSSLVDNLRLIGLGTGDDRMLAVDFDKSGFAALVPGALINRIAPAMHFSALPLCKPMAEAILIEEQDDPVCTDPVATNRETVHATIMNHILSDLGI